MSVLSELYSCTSCPVLLTCKESIFYLSGFFGEGLLLITDQKSYIITDARYKIYLRECCGNSFYCIIANDYFEALQKILITNNYDTVAIENSEISYSDYSKICDMNINIVYLNSLISDKRMIKNDIEISCISNAAKITDAVFERVLTYIYSGITEKELAAYIDYQIRLLGGDGSAFDTIVAFNENAAKPHAIPGNNKLIKDSVVLLDFGSTFNHYCSDMTRTFVFGKADNFFIRIYNTVREANQKAIDSIKQGVTGLDIDSAARNCISNAGFKDWFNHSTGHGVGLKCHEQPLISNRNSTVLPFGTVFTVEPGIYIESGFGVRIEDLIYLGKSGKIVLTKSTKDLLQI